jgi:diguanylate cyclase
MNRGTLPERPPSQRLGTRLTRATMAAACLALLVAGVLLNVFLYHSQRAALADDSVVQARITAENVAASLVFRDAPAAAEALATLHASPRVVGAELRDTGGQVFASWHAEVGAAARPPLVVRVPVRLNARVLGELDLRVSYAELERRSAGFAGLTALAALLALGAAYLLAWRVRRAIDRTEAHLDELAFSDPVTGLANRRAATDHLAARVRRHERGGPGFGVLLLDLDDFSRINDSLGHAAGDAVLRALAQRLDRDLAAGMQAFRIGGDEFMIAFDSDGSPERTQQAGRVARQALDGTIAIEGATLHVHGSAGIALCPADGRSVDALMRCADMAMYRAKHTGKNGVLAYDAAMAAELHERLRTENELRLALARDELTLAYQPIVDLASERVVGAEALVRWRHPERGLLGPALFIDIAERSGLVIELGQQVLRLAARQIAAWEGTIDGPFRVAVNASARQLQDGLLLTQVQRALREYHVAPERLEIEITEHTVVADQAAAVGVLSALRAMGVRISIDDFGTGLSSLSCLRALPVDKLKIDRSFVQELPANAGDAAIVRAVVSMAGALGLRVVAEGIETAAQAHFLRSIRVDLGQGYAYGRPLLPEDFAALLPGAAALREPI